MDFNIFEIAYLLFVVVVELMSRTEKMGNWIPNPTGNQFLYQKN